MHRFAGKKNSCLLMNGLLPTLRSCERTGRRWNLTEFRSSYFAPSGTFPGPT